MPARVATASETVACERATIEGGIPEYDLMTRAGESAAAEIASRFPETMGSPVAVVTGSGNNGGDGWVVANSLGKRGFPVKVFEAASPKTSVAARARDLAMRSGAVTVAAGLAGEPLVVDALLGTGATGVPRGAAAGAVRAINEAGAGGSRIVSLDLPTGLDATTGAHEDCVRANLSVSFGTAKRGQLVARDVCGEIVVVDIGLADSSFMAALPLLVDHDWVRSRIPRIPAAAHKGTRKRLTIVGGGSSMAGAAILAGEGALRAGIGLLRIVVEQRNVVAIHAGLPAAIVNEWPGAPSDLATLASSTDVIAIGPGLGNSPFTRELVERVLLAWSGPIVLDADALNVFEGDVSSLATLLRGRPSMITPHPAEMGRLLGVATSEVVANRFDVGAGLARMLGAAVLLKGSPTVVFAPEGNRYVSATGTAALATGGSGDVLTGVAGTLLAQMVESATSAEVAVCAAFVHGRAAELCGAARGTTLDDILRSLPRAWNERARGARSGVLAELPGVE